MAARRAIAALSVAVALSLGSPAALPGGAPRLASATAAECEGDTCQSPPPAPEDPAPGTASVQGPPNPPVRFAERRRGKKLQVKKRRRHGRHRGGRR